VAVFCARWLASMQSDGYDSDGDDDDSNHDSNDDDDDDGGGDNKKNMLFPNISGPCRVHAMGPANNTQTIKKQLNTPTGC
jgi:hypothetical protein